MTEEPRVLSGRYVLEERIGSGGMADVHRARDLVLRRQVAVKLMRDSVDRTVDRGRFQSEARLMASFDHRHLVTVLDAGIDDDRPWLVMELVEGTTLRRLIELGPLTANRMAAMATDVSEALSQVHDRGVVHRDVKPANILVTTTDRARLADFGVARIMGDTAGLTRTGHTVGTAAYLAPEQIRGEDITGASDVYSLGLVLLEGLTGERAYPGSPSESALARLHHGPLIPTSLPSRWPRLLAAMTSSDPDERPTAEEVAATCSGLTSRGERDGSATLTATVTAPFAALDGSATSALETAVLSEDLTDDHTDERRGLLIAIGALVAFLLVVGLVVLVTGTSNPGTPATTVTGTPTATASPSGHPSSAPITGPSVTSKAPVVVGSAPAPPHATHLKNKPTKKPKNHGHGPHGPKPPN